MKLTAQRARNGDVVAGVTAARVTLERCNAIGDGPDVDRWPHLRDLELTDVRQRNGFLEQARLTDVTVAHLECKTHLFARACLFERVRLEGWVSKLDVRPDQPSPNQDAKRVARSLREAQAKVDWALDVTGITGGYELNVQLFAPPDLIRYRPHDQAVVPRSAVSRVDLPLLEWLTKRTSWFALNLSHFRLSEAETLVLVSYPDLPEQYEEQVESIRFLREKGIAA